MYNFKDVLKVKKKRKNFQYLPTNCWIIAVNLLAYVLTAFFLFNFKYNQDCFACLIFKHTQ